MRPKILLSAYSCDPEKGSEADIGWNRVIEAAKYCDTWVICSEQNNAAPVERYLNANGRIAGLQFVFLPRKELKFGGRVLFWHLSYNLWHRRALGIARRLHEQIGFDLAHQVTFGGFREPGYLWKLNIPFVWGPVGGTQNYPWQFLGGAGLKAAVSESVRNIINNIQLHYSVHVRRAVRHTTALLATNSQGQHDFARIYGITPERMLDSGLKSVTTLGRSDRGTNHCLRILWCGGFEPRKALELLIDALGQWPETLEYELHVVGDGAPMRRWRRLAQKSGIDRFITWTGWLPRAESLKQFEWADVFVFTSLRDTFGNVVLEAFGAGVPVICFDHQGVGDVVTEQCGIKIPVRNRRDASRRFREALELLACDRELLQRLSRGAIKRAQEYLWTAQGQRMANVYQNVLSVSGCTTRSVSVTAALQRDLV